MKAFLIDPKHRTITEVQHNDTLEDYHRLIGCECMDSATFRRGHTVFVDDTGFYAREQHFFAIRGYPQELSNRGLVVGIDEEGETIEPSIGLPWLKDNVSWLEYQGEGCWRVLQFGGRRVIYTTEGSLSLVLSL